MNTNVQYTTEALKKMNTNRLLRVFKLITGRDAELTELFDRQMLLMVIGGYINPIKSQEHMSFFAAMKRVDEYNQREARRSLASSTVSTIKDLHEDGYKRREIAELLGLKLHHVSNVLRGLCYKDVA